MSTLLDLVMSRIAFTDSTRAEFHCRSAGLSPRTIALRCASLRQALQLESCWEVDYVGAYLVAPGVWSHIFVALHEDHDNA